MFNQAGPGFSLADVAAVTDNNRNNGWGFGGEGWWVIILFAMIFGWNGNGNWGNGGNNGAGYIDSAIQRGFDTQTIVSKLDGINAGLCSLGYDQLAQMNNIGQTVQQVGYNNQNTFTQGQIANMQSFNAVMSAIEGCCCNTREAISQVRFDMANQGCETRQAIAMATRDIIDNQNNNYRQLHDEMVAYRMEQKDAIIAEQASLIQALNQAQSQSNQNATFQGYLNDFYQRLRDCPVGAYPVPNPNCCYNANVTFQPQGYGYNGACGCGNN